MSKIKLTYTLFYCIYKNIKWQNKIQIITRNEVKSNMKSVFPSKESFFYFPQNKNQKYKPLDKESSNKPYMTLGWGSNIVYIKDSNDNYFYIKSKASDENA